MDSHVTLTKAKKANCVSVRWWVSVVMMADHENDSFYLVAAQHVQQIILWHMGQMRREGLSHLCIVLGVG